MFIILWHGKELRSYTDETKAKEVFEWFKIFLLQEKLKLVYLQ